MNNYKIYIAVTVGFLFKSLAYSQTIAGSAGKIELKAVVNFKEIADYYKAHPEKKKIKHIEEEDEDEGRPIHTFFEPSKVHPMVKKEEPKVTKYSAYLPVSLSPADTFESTVDDSTTIPPDTHGAVDSNYCVTAINQSVHIQTRKGGEVLNETLDQFWNSVLPGGGSFDPRVHYDPYTHRWIMVADANGVTTSSSIMVAVSVTSDPTGSWNQYIVIADSTGTNWLDFPNVGFNKKWIVITGNMFGLSGGYGGSKVFIFDKSKLLSGSAASYTTFAQDSSFAIAPALTYDTTEQNLFAVESWDGSNGLLKLWKISGAVGSEKMTDVGYPKAPISWQWTAYANSSTSSGADFAPQKGTTNKIQTNDDRVYNLTFRNHKLWLAHNAFFPYSSKAEPTRSSIMWWEVDTTGTPIQNGLLDDTSSTYFYAFPSLAVNANNDVLVGCSQFSGKTYPACVYALHLHSDPSDSIRPVDVYRHGQSNYYKTFSGTKNRWGDYSGAQVDPKNDTDFWTIQETTSSTSNDWDTWWARVTLCTPPVKPSSVTGASSICAGSKGTYSIVPVSGATSYAWKILSGTGWGGSSTNDSIMLTAGSTKATITVAAVNACGTGVADTFTVTSLALPSSAGTISGNTALCKGSTDTLKDTTSGGVWSSFNTGIATVTNGIVTGVSAGTDTIKYSVSNSCGSTIARVVITVDTASAGTISGKTAVCKGLTDSLKDAVTGGTWSSTNTAIATVSSGVVTGVSAGTDTIKYSVSNSCGTTVSRFVVTVGATPSAGTISGSTTLCKSSTATLTDTTSGGIWSSTNTAIATVSSGVVTGVSGGTDTIKYSVSNSCGSAVARAVITVDTASAGTISGTTLVCSGLTDLLKDAVSGGTWSSSNTGIATVSGGLVTGVLAGTDTIKYSVSNSCGTTVAMFVITVGALSSAGTITGSSTVCKGGTDTLKDATSGGVWSSSNTGIATISSGGVVTGVATGSDTVKYSVSSSCGSAVAMSVITVTAPSVGTITGTTTLCKSSTDTLKDATSGGAWSSSNSSIATVSGGVVTGISAGTDTIKYTVSNSCGSAVANAVVTVNAAPTSAGTITGSATVCAGKTDTLKDATSGGAWSSNNAGIATVSGGIATGVSAGTDTIKYTVSNSCGSSVSRFVITVGATPSAGSITGSTTVCKGKTDTLKDATSGGVWSSSNTGIATVSSGVVTGVSAGTDTIKYTVSNSCGSTVANAAITVGAPFAGTITGSATLCKSSTDTLKDATSGGVWSSNNASIATVSSIGVVTGVSGGTDTIKYTVNNSCGSATASAVLTVSALSVSAGKIAGATTLCAGKTDTLKDTSAGGTWSSSNTGIATVSSGIVTGISAGMDTIKYSVSNSCGTSVARFVITVSAPNAGTIMGSATVCTGSMDSLTSTVPGGTWVSGSTYYATISTAGVVTGVNAGSSVIKYTVSNSCGSGTSSLTVIVNTAPYAGTITGSATVCVGSTDTLKDASSGGIWSSGNASIATISSAGTVTGVSSGIDTIKYTLSNSCGTGVAKAAITVSSPSAGTITGKTSVCKGAMDTLKDATTGGTWSSTNTSIATVSGSIVTGVSAGTDTIKYSITNSCGSAVSRFLITVTAPNAGTITGSATVCTGATDSLAATVSGGTWTSVSTYYATISAAGVVTGVNAGSSVIEYTVSNSCGSASTSLTVKVNTLPYAGTISGAATVCAGSTDTLKDATAGGTWSSGNILIATVSSIGVVKGGTAGIDTIKYILSNSCGSAVAKAAITVISPSSGTITGSSSVCKGGMDTLKDAASGGTWSSNNTSIATVSGGIVTGISAGTDTIKYSVSNSCGSSASIFAVTVTAPSSGTITGSTTVCAGATDGLAASVSGGTWISVSTYYATISTAGVVTGVNAGSSVIEYIVSTSCGSATASLTVKVNPLPYAGSISGNTKICVGSTDTLADAVSGGTWSSGNILVATISSVGVVKGGSAGTDTIKYAVSNSCGTATAVVAVTVSSLPSAGTVTGKSSVIVGSMDSLKDLVSGGIWNSSNVAVATVGSSGIVKGISAGTDTIKYTVSNSCGTAAVSLILTVSSHGPPTTPVNGSSDESVDNTGQNNTIGYLENTGLKLTVVPNPAKDVVIAGYEAASAGNTSVKLMDMSGVMITTMDLGLQQSGSVKLSLGNLAAGMYLIELKSGTQRAIERIVKE